jgi:cation:H+ antiporter
MLTFVLFVLGLVLLIVGAEFLVRGASRLAAAAGIPSLVIGLTVVAFGTSAPELAVSVKSAFAGQTGIAVGNVVGSNTFNILFILGLSALVAPLVAAPQLLWFDVPVMVGASFLLVACCLDGTLGPLNGAVLFTGIVVYTGLLVRMGRSQGAGAGDDAQVAAGPTGLLLDLLAVAGGLGMLVLGARWLVDSAVTMAQALGVSEEIIGLTIVAAGTSLPEVATSVLATLRGQRDIAIGNVVGSSTFNILCVLGLTSLVSPAPLPVSAQMWSVDLPVALVSAVACLPIFYTGRIISRAEGGVLLAYYGVYTTYLVLAAIRHPALSAFSGAVLWVALPLTAVGLVASVLHSRRQAA